MVDSEGFDFYSDDGNLFELKGVTISNLRFEIRDEAVFYNSLWAGFL